MATEWRTTSEEQTFSAGRRHLSRLVLAGPVRFASFIPPGRYSRAHPRLNCIILPGVDWDLDTAGETIRRNTLSEIEPTFAAHKDRRTDALILGGLDGPRFGRVPGTVRPWLGSPCYRQPRLLWSRMNRSWQSSDPPLRSMDSHLDAQDRWLDHHAIGLDGLPFHWGCRMILRFSISICSATNGMPC